MSFTRYTGYTSPPYPVQFTDDTGAPINLTGVNPATGFTIIMQDTHTLQFQHGVGTWTITDAVNGKASYQWTAGDLANPGTFLIYVTVQLPGEPSPRAFDPDTVIVVLLETGGVAVSGTDINLVEVNGQPVSSANPVPISGPVQMADGANVTQGAKGDTAITDPTVSATEIALLKGLVKILALQGVAITATDGAITSLGGEGDAAWSGSGNGTAIAILKKIEALLAATQTIAGNVTEANSATINTHLANIDTDALNIATNTGNTATNTSNINTHAANIDTATAASKTDLDTLAGIVSANKAAVKAASGDFAAGSLVDLATYLTLAGAPGDANTVNSLMGRLTKLRDLLNNIAYDNTNEVKVSNYGKSTAAGDTAIKVNSSGDQYVLGDFTEMASLSAGSLNADLVASTDVSAYKWFSLHINTNAYSGTLSFQGSNDNVNWSNANVYGGGGLNNIAASTSATSVIWTGPVGFRYLRIRMTAYTSGAAQGTLELYTSPGFWIINSLTASQTGTWTMQPGNTPNTTPWLESIHDGTNKANVLAATSVSNAIGSQGALLTGGAFAEQASLSAGSLNADLVASTDVSNYKWLGLQITGAWVGTLSFQWSNDNVNFNTLVVVSYAGLNQNSTPVTNTTTNGGWERGISFRYLRVRMTSYTSGTANGVLELYTQSPAHSLQSWVNQESASSWSSAISPIVTPVANTTLNHLISANTTNATSLKATAGQIYRIIAINTNAAVRYLKLFNKASAPVPGTDTPARTIGLEPNVPFVFESTIGMRFGTGIGFATTTGIADNDSTVVGANDLAIDIDWI